MAVNTQGFLKRMFIKEVSFSITMGIILGAAWFNFGYLGRRNKTEEYYRKLEAGN